MAVAIVNGASTRFHDKTNRARFFGLSDILRCDDDLQEHKADEEQDGDGHEQRHDNERAVAAARYVTFDVCCGSSPAALRLSAAA